MSVKNFIPPVKNENTGEFFIERLKNAGIKNYKREYIWLVCHALNEPEYKILLKNNFTQSEFDAVNNLITRRENGEPLQYILGNAIFYGREFECGAGVLIPREDTEILIDAVKNYYAPEKNFSFLDFGTGTGCIAITLLLEFKNSVAYMLEISDEAKSYALKNLVKYNLNLSGRINFCEPLKCDFIISNPPYIPTSEIELLEKSVKNFEPVTALDGGEDGLNFYRLIFEKAKKILNEHGLIIFEIGNLTQANSLKNICLNYGFEHVKSLNDLKDLPRCVIFKKQNDGGEIFAANNFPKI